MREAARQRAVDEFNRQRMVEGYERFLKELLDQNADRSERVPGTVHS